MDLKEIKKKHYLNNSIISELFRFKSSDSYRQNTKQKKKIESLIVSIYPLLKGRKDINKIILNLDWCAELCGDAFNVKMSVNRIKQGIINLHKIINEQV